MHQDSEKDRMSFFEPSAEERRALSLALAEIVSAQQKAVLSSFMLDENVLHFKHSTAWDYPANDFSEPGEMETVSAQFMVPFQRIVDADMTLISESVGSITKQLTDAVVGKLYETMSDACDRSGNVVKESSLPESVLAALEKVEFSVGADGNVQLPQLHMHPDNVLKLQDQPDEFLEKVREIKTRKSEQAIALEQKRKSKYKVVKP